MPLQKVLVDQGMQLFLQFLHLTDGSLLHILNDFIFLTLIGEVVPMEILTFQRALVDPGKILCLP